MHQLGPADAEHRLLLEALVSYSDACTLPQLTPSCPFYRVGEEGPTCNEECRDVAERHGATSRPVQSAQVGGLVLRGRALPATTAAGVEVFDAGQLFLVENRLPVAAQSTTSLLLNTASLLRPPLIADHVVEKPLVDSCIEELERRSVPVVQVLRSSIADQMAEALTQRLLLPLVAEHGGLPEYVSSNLLQRAKKADDPWRSVLDAYVESLESSQELESHLAQSRRMRQRTAARSDVFAMHDFSKLAAKLPEAVLSDQKVLLAISPIFHERIVEWLSRLLEEGDIEAFVECAPPPPSVFLALRTSVATRDEIGLWVWERFTETDIADWSTSTLLLEWRASRGEDVGGCSRRLLAARPVDKAKLADLALERSSMARGRRPHRHGLSPDGFVRAAVAKLKAGKPSEAAEIFHALLELRPSDGNAWNNYGFCLMAVDPRAALHALQRASLYDLDDPAMNLANRSFAFLHLGDVVSSRAALSEVSIPPERVDHPVYSWHHDESGDLVLVSESISNYVSYLDRRVSN